MVDKMIEINFKDLLQLRELYKPDGLKNYVSFTTIETYISWLERHPEIKHIRFFCLNGDFSDGTFVVTDRCNAYADTLNASTDNLFRLLLLIDYSKGYFFISLSDRAASAVRQAIKVKNVEVYTDDTNLLYFLPRKKALEFHIRSHKEVQLKPISKMSDIQKAYSVWPLRERSSVRFLERVAKYNPSVGTFLKDGNNETLVSWSFRFPTGLLLAVQTDENHYGKGYATVIVKEMSRQIAEIGHDIYAGIFEVNTPSRAMFGKLGFKEIDKVHWICTKINWTDADE